MPSESKRSSATTTDAHKSTARGGQAVGDEPVPGEEPVWLIRIAVILFFIAFAAWLAHEVSDLVRYGF